MEYILNLEVTSEKWYFILPIILMTLDVLSGYIYAWINNDVKSYIMRQGLGKKFGEICYVLVGILSKIVTGSPLIMIFFTCYVIFMELVSLAENCDKLGVPIPDRIKRKVNNKEEK